MNLDTIIEECKEPRPVNPTQSPPPGHHFTTSSPTHLEPNSQPTVRALTPAEGEHYFGKRLMAPKPLVMTHAQVSAIQEYIKMGMPIDKKEVLRLMMTPIYSADPPLYELVPLTPEHKDDLQRLCDQSMEQRTSTPLLLPKKVGGYSTTTTLTQQVHDYLLLNWSKDTTVGEVLAVLEGTLPESPCYTTTELLPEGNEDEDS